MKKARFTETQIVNILKLADSGPNGQKLILSRLSGRSHLKG